VWKDREGTEGGGYLWVDKRGQRGEGVKGSKLLRGVEGGVDRGKDKRKRGPGGAGEEGGRRGEQGEKREE